MKATSSEKVLCPCVFAIKNSEPRKNSDAPVKWRMKLRNGFWGLLNILNLDNGEIQNRNRDYSGLLRDPR